MILACVDGGLICGPVAVVVALSGLLAWLRGKRRCEQHECHDHPCDSGPR